MMLSKPHGVSLGYPFGRLVLRLSSDTCICQVVDPCSCPTSSATAGRSTRISPTSLSKTQQRQKKKTRRRETQPEEKQRHQSTYKPALHPSRRLRLNAQNTAGTRASQKGAPFQRRRTIRPSQALPVALFRFRYSLPIRSRLITAEINPAREGGAHESRSVPHEALALSIICVSIIPSPVWWFSFECIDKLSMGHPCNLYMSTGQVIFKDNLSSG
ncbi:hypothetical protein J3F83DRAFT_723406, partial [Trichoderma novae-zelandiae]